MNHYLDIIMFPIQIIVGIFTIYYTVIALFGMWHRKETNLAAPKSRFAIVVPAHNEAMVLGDLLDNLRILKYPKELYDVFVIADNCTDNTADIARAHGAHVFERENKELVGKGYAMDWVFPKIFALDKEFHKMLYELCGCPYWYELVENLAPHFDRTTMLSFRCRPAEAILDDHTSLLKAIEAKDTAAARTIAARHMQRYTENLATIRKSFPQYFK